VSCFWKCRVIGGYVGDFDFANQGVDSRKSSDDIGRAQCPQYGTKNIIGVVSKAIPMILGIGADPNLRPRIIEGEAMSFGKWFPHCEIVGTPISIWRW
jgi:hypothetical protein